RLAHGSVDSLPGLIEDGLEQPLLTPEVFHPVATRCCRPRGRWLRCSCSRSPWSRTGPWPPAEFGRGTKKLQTWVTRRDRVRISVSLVSSYSSTKRRATAFTPTYPPAKS